MAKSLYTVTITKEDGTEEVSRFFQTLHAARTWAKWLSNQPWLMSVTIWSGQPGGERVA